MTITGDVTLFSNDVRDREVLEFSAYLNDCMLRLEKSACFLSVTYNVGFTFRRQVDRVVSKAAAGTRLLR